ncbi:MAG: adenine phosphoribosyltransferase [Vallitaleaceae bacterium]|jgi:adenine phosphoribosyltransferase|nr:adenine phosphoribosyltransferase [Vallitaleaceae bacterium]
MDLRSLIRDVEDFPKEGIVFKDITTVLQDPQGLKYSIEKMQEAISDVEFDIVIGPESRGFIFGVPLAYNMNKGFVPVRKEGKLPYKTESIKYDLEYGSATIEMHVDSIKPGDRVVVIDDLLATGGTSKAMIEVIEKLGGIVVKMVYLIELTFLDGRAVIGDYDITSIIQY